MDLVLNIFSAAISPKFREGTPAFHSSEEIKSLAHEASIIDKTVLVGAYALLIIGFIGGIGSNFVPKPYGTIVKYVGWGGTGVGSAIQVALFVRFSCIGGSNLKKGYADKKAADKKKGTFDETKWHPSQMSTLTCARLFARESGIQFTKEMCLGFFDHWGRVLDHFFYD